LTSGCSKRISSTSEAPWPAACAKPAGLTAEQRAEGLALADESGQLTDVAMPAEGTEAHVTLLVAEHLSSASASRFWIGKRTDEAVAAFLRGAVERFGRYWRKSAREPGAEQELAAHRAGQAATSSNCFEREEGWCDPRASHRKICARRNRGAPAHIRAPAARPLDTLFDDA
jgi:hypothetical protein